MFAQLVFYLDGVSDQIKLVDLPVITERHHGAGNKVRRAKVTAHGVEGDLHQCKTLRTLPAKCKVKMRRPPASAVLRRAGRATATVICLRASTPVARGNNRTMGRRCATGRCFRTGGTCSAAPRASGLPLCACVTAFWMFCVLGLPWQPVMKAYLNEKTT